MGLPADEDWRRRVIERGKELDHEHRRLEPPSLPHLVWQVAQLRLLRQIAAGWLRQPRSADARSVPRPGPGRVAVTFVGHASVLFSTEAGRFIVDPYLADTFMGMRRRERACLHPRDADEVGLILLTHAHADRLHPGSLRRFPRSASILVPPKCAGLVRGLGFHEVVELAPGESRFFLGAEITAVAARHDGRRGWLDRTWRGSIGYIVKTQGASIYAAGDTAYFSGFEEIGRRLHPDLAILPVGGYRPFAQRCDHLSPLDAAQAFHDLGAKLLLPVGYGSFPVGYESPDEPLAWLSRLAEQHGFSDRLAVLRPGETCQVVGVPGG